MLDDSTLRRPCCIRPKAFPWRRHRICEQTLLGFALISFAASNNLRKSIKRWWCFNLLAPTLKKHLLSGLSCFSFFSLWFFWISDPEYLWKKTYHLELAFLLTLSDISSTDFLLLITASVNRLSTTIRCISTDFCVKLMANMWLEINSRFSRWNVAQTYQSIVHTRGLNSLIWHLDYTYISVSVGSSICRLSKLQFFMIMWTKLE